MKTKQKKTKIHHHALTTNPLEEIFSQFKHFTFRHEVYGVQTMKMTPRLWKIVLEGGKEALSAELERQNPELKPKRAYFPLGRAI